jgi:hypothetical protein
MSDDFVHISDTPVESQTTTPVESQTTTPVETQTTENKDENPSQPEVSAMNEQLGKFFSSILNPESEIKENNDIISNLLGGLLRNLIKNNVNKNEDGDTDEEEDDEDPEDEDEEEDESDSDKDASDKESEHSDKESEHSDKESESDYSEMFIIFENKKTYNYATSYPGARRTMLARFHRFLEKNSSNYMRIEKESERIVVYERQPNTLSPYDEQLLYQIEFFSVEKYVDC